MLNCFFKFLAIGVLSSGNGDWIIMDSMSVGHIFGHRFAPYTDKRRLWAVDPGGGREEGHRVPDVPKPNFATVWSQPGQELRERESLGFVFARGKLHAHQSMEMIQCDHGN